MGEHGVGEVGRSAFRRNEVQERNDVGARLQGIGRGCLGDEVDPE
jgi:hypothetical protein